MFDPAQPTTGLNRPSQTLSETVHTTRARRVHYDAQRYAHPHAQQQSLERAVLEHLNRHRLLRAVDVAAAIAADRRFEAAMSAAQRQLARLVEDRLVQRSVVAHQTVYALTQRGAYRLVELRGDDPGAPPQPWTAWPAVRPSARRVADRSNPQHALLISQTVIAAEALGLTAWTETELRALLKTPPLTVAVDGKPRGLWPDAFIVLPGASGPQLVWVEIDRSRRGSRRLADLTALVRAAGCAVRVPGSGSHEGERIMPLRRIVVLTGSTGIARADLSHLLPRVTVGFTGDSGLVHRGAGLYDVLVDAEQRLSGGRVQTVRRVGARLLVQPWSVPSPREWFDSSALPWSLSSGQWPPAQPMRLTPHAPPGGASGGASGV